MRRLWLILIFIPWLATCDNDAARVPARWTDTAAPATAPIPLPWYRAEQVSLGASLFQTHCAECHGAHAQGAENWRERGLDGRFPTPPLNGTGHAWHHSLDVLTEVIMEGLSGGDIAMPAWKDKLTKQEITAIIAWFQSLWPREIYADWHNQHMKAG